jgi:hypothetical protein
MYPRSEHFRKAGITLEEYMRLASKADDSHHHSLSKQAMGFVSFTFFSSKTKYQSSEMFRASQLYHNKKVSYLGSLIWIATCELKKWDMKRFSLH